MLLFRDYTALPPSSFGCVLAIGNFDSVHLGHRAVLEQAKALAHQHHAPFIVMSFHPHPRCYFAPSSAPRAIDPLAVRVRRIKALGADGMLVMRFNEALARLSADAFVQDVLVEALHVAHVVVGEDFRFGQARRGDIHFLQEQAVKHRFGFTYVPPMMQMGETISSTRIRHALTAGDMQGAAQLLGRPYQIYGRVVHGDKRGREMQTPTANIRLDGMHVPRYGVYAVEFAVLEGGDCKAYPPNWQHGVANLGVRPTFGVHEPLLEVHGFAPLGDVYGRMMRVRLVQHLRDEQAFANKHALMMQIQMDIANAKQIFSLVGSR